MKLADLRPCDVCGEPIGVAFFRVSVEQHVVDMKAARQHLGLTAMLGGASGLAFEREQKAAEYSRRALMDWIDVTLRGGRELWVQSLSRSRDVHGRIVGILLCNGADIGLSLLREGWTIPCEPSGKRMPWTDEQLASIERMGRERWGDL